MDDRQLDPDKTSEVPVIEPEEEEEILYGRRATDTERMTLGESLKNNPGLTLLVVMVVVVMAMVAWGGRLTISKAQEAAEARSAERIVQAEEDAKRARESAKLALDYVGCILGNQQELRLNAYAHFTQDHGYTAPAGPPEIFPFATVEDLKAACARIFEGADFPHAERSTTTNPTVGPPSPPPPPTATTAPRRRGTTTTQRRRTPTTARPATATTRRVTTTTCVTNGSGKCKKDK